MYFHHSYKSDFPNQVHQLNVSIAKNHYLLKDDTIKHQNKKFDINWKNYPKTGKRHLVNYLIRDHFSGCYYAELHPIDKMPDLKSFLFNAWKTKEFYEFKGVPKYLILGNDVIEKYPDIKNFAKNINGFDLQIAENGFSTGIRSVRDWIRCIDYYSWNPHFSSISNFGKYSEKFCREFNLRTNSKKTESNLEKWANNKPRGILIDDKEIFYEKFK
ncbi:hypothetical protein MQE36_05875 [Zhouia spongiae]|uniref:Uncharacterized protein n=1 Tax=Zhouia spongiae TaxID=2202721 RepID=A0ABY3YQ19_9FLAO|nr:hypothetical protein [Zhouia spongiae]UNY99874.1 hypothetical protein MQE36_05875 [Zhouia spongiae]